MKNKSKAVHITSDLINIMSDSLRDGEKEVAKYIHDYLRDKKIDSEIIEFSKGRANVIAQVGKGDGLMLNGHTDTVPIGDAALWKHGTRAIIKGNKLYGRGSSDMKGGVGSILAALDKVNLAKPKRRLVLAFVADEEVKSSGSEWLLKNRKPFFKGVKYGIIAEPTNLKIQIAQKGAMHIDVWVKGKSAHGSTPWEGDSAIYKAARLVCALESLSKRLKTRDKLLGTGTINVGVISGGSAVNVVPERCAVSVDRRIVPGETIAQAEDQIRKILKAEKINYTMLVNFARKPYKISKNSVLVKMIKSIAKTDFTWATGYTEAEMYKSMANIESVVFGPGERRAIHKPDEYVGIDNLNRATSVFEQIIERWI